MPTKKKKPIPSQPSRTGEPASDTCPETLFPIVGIGASAGGLEAFDQFFKEMPPDSGMAFVLISHLDPDHASILPELIQKKTKMKVRQVTDNMRVEPNQVYIIPPNREMAILNGVLQLLEMSRSRGAHLPIDTFFRSLAKDQINRAIGIILSGTGTDGSVGLRAIKGEAGMVMAQDPDSARYDGMPRSAVSTGLVDYVLPPAMMPDRLLRYARHLLQRPAGKLISEADNFDAALQKIYILLRDKTNHDFSLYKKNTICRRIERRMHVHQIDNLNDYIRYLQQFDHEASILFKELLIGVTSFFRDPDAFEILKNKYLPELIRNKSDKASIRVWVPGCSSGEEPYSIAITLWEAIEAAGRHLSVQIFGTDIDKEAIETARAGLFAESISADVNPDRLKKFFTKEKNHYQIKKTIREMIIFAPQNVIKDPPFTKLDLLCCRNLLIYFSQELQKKILPLFHYSLKPGGLLFLGTSETVGQATDLFSLQEKKWKIFRRKPAEIATHPAIPIPPSLIVPEIQQKATVPPLRKVDEIDTLRLVETMLSQSDLPPCVIIDHNADIVYIHGRIGRFLELPEGKTSVNILAMAHPGLKTELSNAIEEIRTGRSEIAIRPLQVKENGGQTKTNLIVRPLPDFQAGTYGLLMVVFEKIRRSGGKITDKSVSMGSKNKSEEVRRLEEELQSTRENLQTTIEELETSNEELKSTNEELQSNNEELQSTNEELETSKEELQSLNEESATVNVELQHKIEELSSINDDMKNLLDATEIALIFLDINLTVRRFTPKVTELIPLTSSDIGRPIEHFATALRDVNLRRYAEKVLENLTSWTGMVESENDRFFKMQMRPYRTVNNVIDGVVITFTDITKLKKFYQDEQRLAAVVKDSSDAVIIYDLKGNIAAWNRGAEKMYGYSEAEALGMNIRKIVPPHDRDTYLSLLNGRSEHKTEPFVIERQKKDGDIVRVWLGFTRVTDESGKTAYIATTERDLAKLNIEALRQITEAKGIPHD